MFHAVATTKIYCRDGCPARPDPVNVQAVRHPAAAEAAGYRPCRRCRPDGLGATADSGPELVCRALQLIAEGVLDTMSGAELARALGTSDRHLRRLFAVHVGTTPDVIARSRRAHLARRLLDSTELTIADIAFAAGFRSIRQMNRVMSDTFRATPTELRSRSRRSKADAGVLEIDLPFRPPLNWGAAIDFLAARSIAGVEHTEETSYARTIRTSHGPGVIAVERLDERHLRLGVRLSSYRELSHIVGRMRRFLDLDCDPTEIEAHLRTDPAVGPLVTADSGRRVPRAWSGFEVAVRAIVGQQISVPAATTMLGRLVDQFGDRLDEAPHPQLSRLFPTPAQLAEASLERLGFIGQRADAIRAVAAAVES